MQYRVADEIMSIIWREHCHCFCSTFSFPFPFNHLLVFLCNHWAVEFSMAMLLVPFSTLCRTYKSLALRKGKVSGGQYDRSLLLFFDQIAARKWKIPRSHLKGLHKIHTVECNTINLFLFNYIIIKINIFKNSNHLVKIIVQKKIVKI